MAGKRCMVDANVLIYNSSFFLFLRSNAARLSKLDGCIILSHNLLYCV